MKILFNWLISALVVIAGAYILPGVHVENFLTALIVALILGVINAILKPILVILTLPINILTLGLFTLVINGALVILVTYLVPGFRVDNLGWAILYSLVLSIFNWFLHQISK